MNLYALTNWVFEEPVLPDPVLVTPTWVGFLATFLLAVAVAFLIFDLARRVRRTNHRAEVAEKLDAEQRALDQAAAEAAEAAPAEAAPAEAAAQSGAPESPHVESTQEDPQAR